VQRALERVFERCRRHDSAEVNDRACRVGRANAVYSNDVARQEIARSMKQRALAHALRRTDRHFGSRWSEIDESLKVRRAPM
jgi:hypothetical protein